MATPILVTGAAGRVGAVGRTVTELLLKQGKAVRAMVRNADQRAQALRDLGAEVVTGDLLDLDSMHRVIAGCETMYFGMSVWQTHVNIWKDSAQKTFPRRKLPTRVKSVWRRERFGSPCASANRAATSAVAIPRQANTRLNTSMRRSIP